MKNKLFLTFILLTPILVITTSSLYFYFGYKPDATKNNGVFFNQYFSFENIKISNDASQLSFDDGKWVLAVYITEKTKAIVIVHYAGIACDMDVIMQISKKYKLFVIEDAAQAIESFYKNRALGSIGHLAAFSFHETKNIISGEGGLCRRRSRRLYCRGYN